jgi:hypothetical protein
VDAKQCYVFSGARHIYGIKLFMFVYLFALPPTHKEREKREKKRREVYTAVSTTFRYHISLAKERNKLFFCTFSSVHLHLKLYFAS